MRYRGERTEEVWRGRGLKALAKMAGQPFFSAGRQAWNKSCVNFAARTKSGAPPGCGIAPLWAARRQFED